MDAQEVREAFLDYLRDLQDSDPPEFLSFKFTYYDSTKPQSAFLQLITEEDKEYLLLSAGERFETEYIGLEESPEEVIEIDEDFDLDFSI